MTKPAKVFGLDESRVWKAENLHDNICVMTDLGENENPEPPDTVAVKFPRDVARQIGRYKEEGETLKAAAERLILEAIAHRQTTAKISTIPKDSNRFPVMVPIYLPAKQLKNLEKVCWLEDDDTYQTLVTFLINNHLAKHQGTLD